MIRPTTAAKDNMLKKRTEAFALFLVRREKYETRFKELGKELEKSNKAMSKLAEKFKWWGSLP